MGTNADMRTRATTDKGNCYSKRVSRPNHIRRIAPIAESIRTRFGIGGMASVYLAAVSIGEGSRHRPGVNAWLSDIRQLAAGPLVGATLRAAYDETMPGWEHLDVQELDEGFALRSGALTVQGEPFSDWLRGATPDSEDAPPVLQRFVARARAGQLPQATIEALDALNPEWPRFHKRRERTPEARERLARERVAELQSGSISPSTRRWLTRCRREATIGTLSPAVADILSSTTPEWRACAVEEFAGV